jgi:DNA-binding response OmpR family regulator
LIIELISVRREGILQRKKVLFFSDSSDTVGFCRRILGKGYELVNVAMEQDGVSGVRQYAPDLVIIDLEVGSERGFWLCRELSGDGTTGDTPVMVLFDRDDRETAERALALGAADFSSKPIIPALFAKRAQTTIERFSKRLPRCPRCQRQMRPEWSFCPFDGSGLRISNSAKE